MDKAKRSYFLSVILIVVFFVSVSFLCEGHAYFGSDPNRNMTDLEFFLTAFGVCLVIAAIFYYSFKRFGVKPKWWLLPILLAMASISCLTLFFQPPVLGENGFSYALSGIEKARYLVLTVIVFLSLYICFAVIPHITGGSYLYNIIFSLAVIFALIAIGWSYINEFDFYQRVFSYYFPSNGYDVPKSFTNNRNIYAFVIFFGIVGTAYSHVKRPFFFHWLLISFFYFNQLLVLSKASIIISTIFFACLICWSFLRTFRAHPYRNSIFSFLVFATLIGLWLGGAFQTGHLLGWFGDYYRYLGDLFISGLGRSFQTRIDCYTLAFKVSSLTPFTFIFGYGYGNWNFAFYTAANGTPNVFSPMDTAFGVDILRGGLIGLLFSCAIWIGVFILTIKDIAKKDPHGWVLMFLLLCIFARSFAEGGDFAYLDASGAIFFLTAYLPAASFLSFEKNKQEKEEVQMRFLSYSSDKHGFLISLEPKKIYAALVPIISVLLGASLGFANYFGLSIFSDPWFLGDCYFVFLAGPLTVKAITDAARSRKAFSAVSFALFGLFLIMALVLPFFGIGFVSFLLAFIILSVLWVILIMNGVLRNFRMYLSTLLLPFFLSLLLIGANVSLIHWLPDAMTAYSYLCLAIIDVLVPFFLNVVFLGTFDREIAVIEERFLHFVLRLENKDDFRYLKAISPKSL